MLSKTAYLPPIHVHVGGLKSLPFSNIPMNLYWQGHVASFHLCPRGNVSNGARSADTLPRHGMRSRCATWVICSQSLMATDSLKQYLTASH